MAPCEALIYNSTQICCRWQARSDTGKRRDTIGIATGFFRQVQYFISLFDQGFAIGCAVLIKG